MVYELIEILKNDSDLRVLLEASLENSHIEALNTDITDKPAIVYTFTPISDNGTKESYRLEVRAICKDIERVINITERVKALWLKAGDSKTTNNITSMEVNGGGMLQDYGTGAYHNFLYFNIIRRK